MPPSSTIDRKIRESAKVKFAGAMKLIIMPSSAPATPIMKLPSMKAVIFQRAGVIPKQLAASSSIRVASMLRPTHERSTRRVSAKAPISSSKASR